MTARCDCGLSCRDLGTQGGCRYAAPADDGWSPLTAGALTADCAHVLPEIRNALRVALAFMEGFEGDDLQDGIDERIDTVRSALKAAEGRI